jgi:murein DD-endopeptidase MepM/ murein hydrolase activator NlpD
VRIFERTRAAVEAVEAEPESPPVGLPTFPTLRSSLALTAAIAATAAQTAHAQTGGAEYVNAPPPAFSVTPASIAPGATLTISYRIGGRPRRVRVRVDLVPEAGGRPAASLALGRQSTGKRFSATWRPKLAPGRYTARLRATTLDRSRARTSQNLVVEIVAPPVTAASGVFPVQGTHTLGGAEARFGAPRTGHIHQGQDIMAAAGTPVVSPRTGFVAWRAFQRDGAGHYVVVHGDDARDYVFMHLQDGSVAVQKGQAVSAGQQLGAVGSTGRSAGPHLHFEIWPQGWYSSKASKPVDPLPDLLAWAS